MARRLLVRPAFLRIAGATFVEQEEQSKITVEIEYLSQEARDAAVQPGFEDGFAASYMQLDELFPISPAEHSRSVMPAEIACVGGTGIMSSDPRYDIAAIDTVLNPITQEIIEIGPSWRSGQSPPHPRVFDLDKSEKRTSPTNVTVRRIGGPTCSPHARRSGMPHVR